MNTIKDKCEENDIVLHDFAEIVERLPMLKINLDKKHLSVEYSDL